MTMTIRNNPQVLPLDNLRQLANFAYNEKILLMADEVCAIQG